MMIVYCTLLVLLLTNVIVCFLVPDGRVPVHSPVGEIVGFSTTLRIKGAQKVVQTFLGIPYAEPPTGARRFRKPVPKASFRTAFDATQYGPVCYQLYNFTLLDPGNVIYDEDCLRLNIFAPENQHDNTLYPVMVWIHGGGFIIGSSNLYEAGPLSLSGDVIVVTMNYRLNVFGFLCTNDSSAGGNWGLWDQHLAIRWVHDNIQAFGGDPTKVTIFGESAGSASVAYQTIYPGNQGLFQRAIAQSGSIQSPWAFRKSEEALNIAREFATLAGCTKLDSLSIISCLQSKSGAEISNIQRNHSSEIASWSPVIDGQFVFDDPKSFSKHFPSKQVENMFLSVDLIVGVNSKEGFVDFGFINDTTRLDYNKSYIDTNLIPDILAQYAYSNGLLPLVKDTTVLEYTDWTNLDNDNKQFDRFIDLVSELMFFVPAALTARKHTLSAVKHTYVYKLSAAPPKHLLPVFAVLDGPTVANHGDDLSFIFGPWFQDDYRSPDSGNLTATDEQKNVAKAMITMWTNFAKTGYVFYNLSPTK